MSTGLSPSCSTLICFPVKISGKAAKGGPEAWVAAALMGDLGRGLGGCLWPSPVPAVEAVWRINQQMENRSLFLFL